MSHFFKKNNKIFPNSLKNQLLNMNIKKSKNKNVWIKEARRFVDRQDISDKNFKHFYLEFIEQCKDLVDLNTNRLVMSILQKHTNLQMTKLRVEEEEMEED